MRVTHHCSTDRIDRCEDIALEFNAVRRADSNRLDADGFHTHNVPLALPAVTSENRPLHDDRLPVKMLNDRILVKLGDAEGERRSSGGIPVTSEPYAMLGIKPVLTRMEVFATARLTCWTRTTRLWEQPMRRARARARAAVPNRRPHA